MATYTVECEEEFTSEDVLSDEGAKKQLDIMWKQIGGRLDQFRREYEWDIIHTDPNGIRKWNIKLKLDVECHDD